MLPPLKVLAAALSTSLAAGEEIPHLERKSGYAFMSRETRAMQDDDSTNPGMLWVLDGESMWSRKLGAADKACADCHGDALTSMKGVAARYPAFVPDRERPCVARRLGKADQQQRQRRAENDGQVVAHERRRGEHRRRETTRHVSDGCNAV